MFKKDVAILDIGSMAMTVMVAERGVNGTFKIKGKGEADYGGFQKGEFLEPDQVKYAIGLAVANAETSYGSKITDIYVGVPGEFTSVICRDTVINFTRKKKINDNDVRQLFHSGNIYKKHPTHSVINQSPIYFMLDDGRRIIEPRGNASTKLRGFISYVLAENNFIDFIDNILAELGIRNAGFLSSCLAESMHLFDPSVRDRYVILVDCGYITTSVMLARGDGLLFLNSFSLGGGYITGDLSQCLKIPFTEAESLKHKVVLSWDANENDTYEVPGKDFVSPFSARVTNQIVEDRLGQIAQYINKCLDRCEFEYPEFIPVYLTGGGINFIRGARDLVARRLGRKVELVAPNLPHISRPDYSSEIGLLDMALELQAEDSFLLVR
ncbi:MAG: hypothetical protein IKC11_02535 [Clostridia bacterium]|nr:hypothetical protein [Clostridia bacterium]